MGNPEPLYRRLLKFEPSRKEFKEVKDRLKKHWKGEEMLDSFDLAAYFYFNHNTSYGPGFLGWPSEVYLNKKRYKTMLGKVHNSSVTNLEVRCVSFGEPFGKYPNDFF